MGLKWAYRRLCIAQMTDFDFFETTNASSFKISHDIALVSICILIGNDDNSYIRSAANRIDVFIFVHVQITISQ